MTTTTKKLLKNKFFHQIKKKAPEYEPFIGDQQIQYTYGLYMQIN